MPAANIELLTEGFQIRLLSGIIRIAWNEVQEIQIYKADLITTDVICADLILDITIVTVTEETSGWETLMKEAESQLKGFDVHWYDKIVQLPFAEDRTTVYKR
jgi:hypothetical protein